MRRRTFLVAFVVAAYWAGSAATAATLTVDLNGGADYTDIQSAIDAAADGDTVLVKPGEYVITEPINFNRLHDPDDPASPPVKDIVVRSEGGADVTTIRMAETPADPQRGAVLLFKSGETAGSTVQGFTITGGRGMASDWCDGDWCRFGGGIHIRGASPRVVDCRVVANSVDQGWGAGIYSDDRSSPSFIDCRIAANTLGPKGIFPGVVVFGSATFIACAIEDHTAVDKEAAFACRSGAAILKGCTIRRNASGGFSAVGYGGPHDPSPTLTDCLIEGNCARYGGGIRTQDESDGTFIRCTIRGNYATEAGGGVFCGSPNSTVVGGVNTFRSCRIEGNYAPQGGGLLISKRDATVLDGCVVLGNGAERSGAAALNGDTTTMVNCVVVGNAGSEGAGAMWLNGATVFTNCTFASNPGADPRSDLVCSLSQVHLVNCILPPVDVSATCLSRDACYEGNAPGFTFSGEFDFSRFRQVTIGGTPRALPDFIVAEPDLHLLPSAPAVDAGDRTAAPATDIEGNARPCGGGVDLGAYELCDAAFLRGDANGDRRVDISDAIWLVRELFRGGAESACGDASDANDDGRIDISDALLVIDHQFLGGPSPALPFPACAADATPDDLGCLRPTPCGNPP